MTCVERLEWNDVLMALVLRVNYEEAGTSFVTPQDNPLQLGTVNYQQGYRIKPHIHKSFPKTIDEVQEVLHIQYGKVEAEFYESSGKKVGSAILNAGDTILLLSGAHGFNFLEDSKMIEVKQGPYYGGGKDKSVLNVEVEDEGG